MFRSNTRQVVPAGPYKSAVTAPSKTSPNSTHHAQGAGAQAAKKELKPTGGNVGIHRSDGTYRDADTIAAAKDSLLPRDTSH